MQPPKINTVIRARTYHLHIVMGSDGENVAREQNYPPDGNRY